MRIITIAAALIVAALMLSVAWLYSSDDTWEVSHRATINAPAEVVYSRLASLKALPEWSAWNTETIPTLQSRYSGPDAGVGASEFWSYEGSSGSTLITETVPNSLIKYKVVDSSGYFVAEGRYELTPTSNGTGVNWVYGGDTKGNLIMKLIMLSVEPQIDQGNEWSLNNLKKQLEGSGA